LGSSGVAVLQIQGALNRIAQNYPAIPKITPMDGLFGPGTEDAVKKFQEIFDLTADGVVGAATWNQIIAIYVAVTRLAELRSEGQRYLLGSFSLPAVLSLGSSGEQVSTLQYMLSTLSSFISEIPNVTIDGQYGLDTRDAVLAYQRFAGLTPSGLVGNTTWDSIYNRFSGITGTVLDNASLFPSASAMETIADVQRSLQTVVSAFSAIDPPRITGVLDRNTTRAIGKLQSMLGLKPTGQITAELRRDLELLSEEQAVRFRQYPGRVLYQGQRDPSSRKAVT
jgi:peptidoglycan hydrolase-like protein with peptidoglycan-binding domain